MSEHAHKAHSDFGGSVIGRVIACPGSVPLCNSVPERLSSSYADEGTFAHALGEKHLRALNFDAQQSIGDEIESDKLASKKVVTTEMAAAVQVYLDAVQAEMVKTEDAILLIEERFTLPIGDHEEVDIIDPRGQPGKQLQGEVFGANDALVYHPSTGRMVVFDYKHGQGVSVSAEDNKQLKFYAAGAALSHPDWPIAELELVIVQPRARDADEQDIPGVKPWPMDTFELLEFVAEVEQAVAAAKAPGAPVAAGSHCRWCAAASVCPAKKEEVIASIGLDFHDIEDIAAKALPLPKEMSTDKIAALLRGLDTLTAWANQVRDYAYGLLEQGVAVPGFKLVDKVGRRKWIDNEAEIAAYLEMVYGVEGEDVMPRKLVTITEAERLVKARVTEKAERKAALDDLSLRFTLKDSGGRTMVADTDRRDAVPAGAAADFAGVNIDGA